MLPRSLVAAFIALFILVPTASAQDVAPLAGKGENFQPIARVKIPRVNEVEMAGDWAFLSQDKTESGEGGLVIVNVADPAHPYIQGHWTGDQAGLKDVAPGDVDRSPDGNLAVLTNAHCSPCKEGEVAWAMLIDTHDKAHPSWSARSSTTTRWTTSTRRRSTTTCCTSTRRSRRSTRSRATARSRSSTSP